MTTLHIFNPSHDEALASGSPYYTPTRAARLLGADLSVLPAWWAADGDAVLTDEGCAILPEIPARRGVRFVRRKGLTAGFWAEIGRIEPWGWDACLAHRLRRLGAPERLLPSDAQLAELRALSSRRTAVNLLKAVRHDVPGTVGASYWCASEAETWQTVARLDAGVLKAPWSGSGRGVFRANTAAGPNIRHRVARILQAQGGIEAEPYYRKRADLAVEFTVTDEGVRDDGLSLFLTSEGGTYSGNIVADESTLRAAVDGEILPVLDRVRDSLRLHLAGMAGSYRGPVGVDMMTVWRDDGTTALHPCIEVNVRNTMGRVALYLRHLQPEGTQGFYRLRNARPDDGALRLTPGAAHTEAVIEAAGGGTAFENKR